MEKLQFSITINAPKEKVWHTLWNDTTYPQWTSVFAEGSVARSDWKEGSKILFLSGTGSGMYSIIDKITPNQYMAFKHMGEVKEGVELPYDDTKEWIGAMETYTLEEEAGITHLTATIDMSQKEVPYFNDTFPAAFKKLKEIAEAD